MIEGLSKQTQETLLAVARHLLMSTHSMISPEESITPQMIETPAL